MVLRDLEEGEELSSVSCLITQSSTEVDSEIVEREYAEIQKVVAELLKGREPQTPSARGEGVRANSKVRAGWEIVIYRPRTMERAVEEDVVLEVSSGSDGAMPRVRGALTGALSGLVTEGNRLIGLRDRVGWNMAEGTVDPVVRATVGPPAEPANRFDSVEKLEEANSDYFAEGSERAAAGMEVGRWGAEQSLKWTHRRGFVIYEYLLAYLDVGLPFT